MDKDILMETGRRKGLTNREHIEKDYFQDLFLYKLFRKTNKLVFKGGTALYKIYKLPRFSENLDFTSLEHFDAEQLIGDIVEPEGSIKSTRKTGKSVLIRIVLKGILTSRNTIRFDISLKNRVLRGFDVKSYVPEYIDINPFSLRVMKPEEMVAEKIHSIMAREKARDLYDMFFLLRMSRLDLGLVNEKLALFDMRFCLDDFRGAINNLETLWERELRPFVLTELADFRTVKDYVLERIG